MTSKPSKTPSKPQRKGETNSNMQKKYSVLLLILALAATSGLPHGRELEERQIITALCVDRFDAEISLTALTAVRASENEEPELLAAQGFDMDSAIRSLQSARASQAYLGQTEKLLLGEGIAASELLKTLEYVLDHHDLRLDTLLYVVKGSAGEGLSATAPTVSGETPGRDERGVSVAWALSQLCEGRRVEIPALALGDKGSLEPAGWAVLAPSGLLGYTGKTVTASVCGEGARYG